MIIDINKTDEGRDIDTDDGVDSSSFIIGLVKQHQVSSQGWSEFQYNILTNETMEQWKSLYIKIKEERFQKIFFPLSYQKPLILMFKISWVCSIYWQTAWQMG